MLDIKEHLRELWQQGVEVYLEEGELRYKATPLTEAQTVEKVLQEHSREIIEILQKEPKLYTGFPLSHGQHAMVLMQEIAPTSTAYNATAALQLKEDLNIALLEQSMDFLIQRHEALRTEFCRLDGELAQRVLPYSSTPLQVVEVEAYGDDEVGAWVDELADIPFDMSTGPNFITCLLDNKNPQGMHNRYILLILGHHATIDFIAVENLASELATVYTQLENGEPIKLLPVMISYKEYVIAETQALAGERGDTLWSYWQPQVSSIKSVLELPIDFPRPAQQSFKGAEYKFTIDALLYAAIKNLATQLRATPFVIVMAAYQRLVQRYARENTVALGVPMGNRSQFRCQKVVGHFTNAIPLITDLSPNPSFEELVAQDLELLKGAMTHQDLPLPDMVNRLQLEYDLSRPALVQTGFSWNQTNYKRHNVGTGSIIEEVRRSEQRGAIYDLVMSGYDNGKTVECSLRYNTDLFKHETVGKMSHHFLQLLRGIIAAPQEPVNSLVMVPNRELGQILDADFSQLEAILPLTATQQDLYLAHMINADTETNSMGVTAAIKADVDANIIREELQRLVDGNRMLRGHIVSCDKRYCDIAYWIINKKKSVNFIVSDLSEKALDDEAMRDYINGRIYRPYDVHDELYHFELIKRGPENFILLGVTNHIVFDGVALNTSLQQCLSNYELRIKGEPVKDTEDKFSAYITKARDQFDSYKNRRFWEQKFASVEALDIPTPTNKDDKQIYKQVVLDSQHLQAIKHYSSEHDQFGASTSTGGVARYFKVLYCLLINAYARPTGDFQIRDTWNNRSRDDKLTIGCYHQMVPFVAPLALMNASTNINTLFAYTRKHTQDITDHSQISLLLQNQLAPPGQLGFMYNFYITRAEMPFGAGKAQLNILAPMDVQGQVQLVIKQEDNQLLLSLLYNNKQFSDLHFLERLMSLSTQVLDGAQQVGDLHILLDNEREQLLSTSDDAWNATKEQYEPATALHHLIEQQVERSPDALAVTFAEASLTYRELNEQANQLAHYLLDNYLPDKPEDRSDVMIGLCMERSLEMSVALLAVLKAGCAYVPFDPSFPQERLGFMLEDTQVPLMLTQSHLSAALPAGLSTPSICLDTESVQWSTQADTNPVISIDTEQLFNVIFTSGSTGKPKGVMVPHRGIINRLQWMQKTYPLDASDHVLQKTPYSFDVSVWELFWPLMVGAQLIYAKPEGHKDPDYLRDIICEQNISTLHFVPSMLGVFLQSTDIEKCSSIRRVFCSGEALQPEHVRRFFDRIGHSELHNLYGPTEASVDVSYFACQANTDYRSVPIGKPVANTQLHILNDNLQPVPAGIVGELYIGGVQLARGYLKREELSRETFIDNPFYEQGHPSKRLYKTGDLARYLDDGNIEYIGRVDFQVKVRGLRIELGEIENVLHQHAQVKETLVITKDLGADNVVIVAYLVAENPDNPPSDDELRKHLAEQLPEYMLPNFFVTLDAMPLSPNGKTDRKALPEPNLGADGANYVAPTSELEQQIASIWQEMLQISKIGINDNFFEHGGHSLLATQTASRLQEVLKINVGIRTLFDFPTIATLAQQLDKTEHGQQLPPIKVMDRPEQMPLSLAQHRLWFVEQLNPGNVAYNMPAALRFHGPLDQQVLSRALHTIIERHEPLRTRFINNKGQAEQQIDKESSWSLTLTDISHLNSDDQQQEIKRKTQEIAQHVFDLSCAPLLSVELLQISDQEHMLLFCMHHIISDGWSLEVLLSELGQLWQAYEKGEANPLADLKIQYSDYSLWQRDYLQGELLDTQLDYWREQLADAPALLQLPTDRPRPAQQSFKGAVHRFEIPEDTSKKLKAMATQQNASLFMMLLTAYSVLLGRYSQQDDICIGFPISGRNAPELEGLIGLFINNLVIRTDLAKQPNTHELIQSVRQTTLAAYEHQDVPFDLIVDALQLERSLSYAPLVQASFTLQNQSLEQHINTLLGHNAELVDIELISAKYDLALTCYDNGQTIVAEFEYATDLFEQTSIERLSQHYLQLMVAMMDQPQQAVQQLPILGEIEVQQLLTDWNASRDQVYDTFPLHRRFEQCVARFPDRIAVSCSGDSLSYRQINQRANQVARELQKRNVAVGDFVGLCLDRSLDLMIGLLGILKAGAAYIPLDPHFPSDRLAFILEDSEAKVLLSRSEDKNALIDFRGENLLLDTDAGVIGAQDDGNLDTEVPTDSIIYVLYTSGTTGKPKGCLVTHANVARLFTATEADFGFNEQDVWTLFHSYAFDFTVWEMWGALLYGGELVVTPYDISRSPDEFYQLLDEKKVTVLNQTPSAFSQLIAIDSQQAELASPQEARKLQSLRYVIFGGEALDFNALKTWTDLHGFNQPQLINMYGITETTVHVTHYPISEKDLSQASSIIGRPINDLHLHILDKQGQLLPIGVPGELYISGPGVTNGYLKRDDLSAEKFIDNPFIETLPSALQASHQKSYRSGDLGRYLPGGEIEYMGRIDHQVKIRGHRIELGEIEASLAQIDTIREALVLVHNEGENKRLAAYLLVSEDEEVDFGAVRSELANTLPDYMIPLAYVSLTAWPLTPTGKIDQKSLPSPEGSGSSTEYIEPRNDTEESIASIWSELLEQEKIGINDNFFELGGHSLIATQVMSRINELMNTDLALRVIFESPTVAQLAVHLLEAELADVDLGDENMEALLAELLDESDDADLDDDSP